MGPGNGIGWLTQMSKISEIEAVASRAAKLEPDHPAFAYEADSPRLNDRGFTHAARIHFGRRVRHHIETEQFGRRAEVGIIFFQFNIVTVSVANLAPTVA